MKRLGGRTNDLNYGPGWRIDITKVVVPVSGWRYLAVVLDWLAKKIVGHDLAGQSRAGDLPRALQLAVNAPFAQGLRDDDKRLLLVSDNGSQSTSRRFMQDRSVLRIEQVITRYNNSKGNADTERLMQTIETDPIWPDEFLTADALAEGVSSVRELLPPNS